MIKIDGYFLVLSACFVFSVYFCKSNSILMSRELVCSNHNNVKIEYNPVDSLYGQERFFDYMDRTGLIKRCSINFVHGFNHNNKIYVQLNNLRHDTINLEKVYGNIESIYFQPKEIKHPVLSVFLYEDGFELDCFSINLETNHEWIDVYYYKSSKNWQIRYSDIYVKGKP